MKKKLKLLLINIFLFTGLIMFTHAQDALTLEQIIEISLEKNYSLRIVRNQELVSANNYSRGNAGLLPSLDLRSSFAGNLNNSNQNFSNGSDAQLRSIHNTTSNLGLQGSWMLYDGFSGQIRYRQLEELKSMAELNTRISIENLVARIASEYYFYIQQKRLFTNLKYAVDLSRERVRIEQEHFLLGSGSKVRLLQAEVSLNADSSRLERQYDVLRASGIRLGEFMSAENLNAGLMPADTSIIINDGLLFSDLQNDILNQNTAILAANQNQTISEFDFKLIEAGRLPYLNLNSGYGFTHNTYQNSSLSSQQSWGMNYSITLGVNLYNGKNQQRLRSNARIGLENRTIELERTIQEINADFFTIYNAYSNNLRLLNLENQNLAVARENLDIAFERYRLGGLSGFELREVQKDLLEAEERLLSIQYQAKMAEISLMQLSGRILD
jgi:outer membrane protein, adhesin transport system